MRTAGECIQFCAVMVSTCVNVAVALDKPAELQVAAFSVDITPPLNTPVGLGFIPIAKSVEHPLMAKGIVLRSSDGVFVLCALDWMEVHNSSHTELCKRIAEAAGTTANRVAVHCLHQHTAPAIDADTQKIGLQKDDPRRIATANYFGATARAIEKGVTQATRQMQPLTHIGTSRAKVEKVASNRRLLQPDGSIRVRSSSAKDPELHKAPEGRIDPWLRTVSFFNGRQAVAQLHYYASHPQSFYGDARISYDVPGIVRERLEKETGVAQIYFTGCGGDVAFGKYNNGTRAARDAITARMYDGMRRSIANVKRQDVSQLRWRSHEFKFPPRRDPAFTADPNRKILKDPKATFIQRLKASFNLAWVERDQTQNPVSMSCLDIGNVQILNLPGEMFVQYQLAAQKMRPQSFVAVASYGDCGMSYVGGDRIYTDRGGYEQTYSFAGPCEQELIAAIDRLLKPDTEKQGAIREPERGAAVSALTIQEARIVVTGHDVNRPDPFPGRGEFSWPGNIVQRPDGELIMVHSAGYYHVSFAQPRLIEPQTRKKWLAEGWPLDFKAPTGGRSMITRSRDGGRTWSRPQTLIDLPLDDAPYGLLRCRDGSLLCFINVQASWYGFSKAPQAFRSDLGGLNTQQCVVRSTDSGKTWSKPIWLKSPGDFYERSHAQPLLLPNGSILLPAYYKKNDSERLFGAIHRSDDHGKTWETYATITRKGRTSDSANNQSGNIDEPAIARLPDGQLFLITRPDGGYFLSADDGKNWDEQGRLVTQGKFKAPRLFVLKDGTVVCVCTYRGLTVFLGNGGGKSWSKPLALDKSSYGYPGGAMLEDESMLISYCSSGRAPNRIHVVRFRVNEKRNGIELLRIGGQR